MRTLYFHLVVSSIFFSSPILSCPILYVYHTSTRCGLSANLECMSEMCCMMLAEKYRTQKKSSKFAIWAPLHKFIGLYLRN